MKAMVIRRICNLSENREPLEFSDMPEPKPGEGEIVIRVNACGVCHTEIDEIEGRTPPSTMPMIPGHQIVGRVVELGKGVKRFRIGDRVGVAWIHGVCGRCRFCVDGKENLCERFEATGRDVHGGYAEYTKVREDFAYEIPEVFSDAEAAPLLCAGAIGYRSLRLSGHRDGQNIGLVGFGASAHLVIQLIRFHYPNSRIFVFARGEREREFAKELGAVWAGGIEEESPEKIHSAIDTTPVWKPVVEVMKNIEAGGRLVINAIRKEEIDKNALLRLDYARDLWLEKEIKSVANVTREDVREFLYMASQIPIKPECQLFTLSDANHAILELKEGRIKGAKVLVVD